MSIIAIALTSDDNRVRYTDAVAGVRVVGIETLKGIDVKSELARADGPIGENPDRSLDEQAADELLARTGYQRMHEWRGTPDGWVAVIEPEHAPGWEKHVR